MDYKQGDEQLRPTDTDYENLSGADSATPTQDKRIEDPLIGIVLDQRYRITSLLARGGMATVYHAVDLRLDRDVAVKVMHPHLVDSASCAARFQQEAKAVARLIHPHIVTVFDQGQVHGTAYIVMELVEGITVREKLAQQGPLSVGEALELIRIIAQGLDAAHRSGIVHRDIKPENILLTSEGNAKIADFGLARTVSEISLNTHSTILGTVAYVPPELVTEGRADARGDLYSLGIMLYELLTGITPFHGYEPINIAYSHVHKSIPQPSTIVPWLPTEIDDLVADLTARDPDERIASASSTVEQIASVYSTLPDEILTRRFHSSDVTNNNADTVTLGEGSAKSTTLLPVVASETNHTKVIPTQHQLRQSTQEIPLPKSTTEPVRKNYKWLWIVTAVVLIVGLGSALGFWWYREIGPGAYAIMPTVEGSSVQQALDAVEEAGLTAETQSSYSDTVKKGDVITSTPEAGSSQQKSVPVQLRISAGVEMLTVPKLVGEDIEKAKDSLRNLRFLDPTIKSEWSETVPDKVIIASNLEAGTEVRHDTVVQLTVSKGREPFEVPELSGKPKTVINEQKLEDIYSIEIAEQFSDKVPEGNIISQDPEAGKTVHRGDKLKIVVSKGPELVEIPRLFGLRTETAKKRLEDAGFKVKIDRFSGGLLNLVRYATPAQGKKVPKGSTVTLTIF